MTMPARNIRKDLQLIQSMAEADLQQVNDLIKKHFVAEMQLANHGNNVNADAKVAQVIMALQQINVFVQRIQHIISTYDLLITPALGAEAKKVFNHLHFFQLLTVEFDLVKAVETITSLIDELKISLASDLEIQLNLFMHFTCIKKTLDNILRTFSAEGGDVESLPAKLFSDQQIDTLATIYATAAERFVLNWFITYMPLGTAFELLTEYTSSITSASRQDNDSVLILKQG
jgi:hypothetical protein